MDAKRRSSALALRAMGALIFTLALTACSKYGRLSDSEKYTTVKISAQSAGQGLIAVGPDMLGGVMIWGKNTAGTTVGIYLPTNSAYQNVTLPFGDWTFGAIGWPGASGMQGVPRCGVQTVNVSSGTSAVSIAISQAGCLDTKFTANGAMWPLRLIRCNTLLNVVNGSSDCTGIDQGDIQSFKVRAMAYDPSPAGNPQATNYLETSCFTISGSTYTSTLSLPDGEGSGSPMYFKILGYPGSASCSGTPEEFDFRTGFRAGSSTGVAAFHVGSGGFANTNSIFLKHGTRAAPAISDIRDTNSNSITNGGWGGKTTIVIVGTNFDTTATVTVGGVSCPISAQNSTSITCIPPRSSTLGTKSLVVTNVDGQTAASSYTYVEDGFGNGSDRLAAGVGTNFSITGGFGSSAGGSLGSRSYHSFANISNIAATTSGSDVAGKTLTLSAAFTTGEYAVGDEVMWHVSAAGAAADCTTDASLVIGQFGFSRVASVDTGSNKLTLETAITTAPNNTNIVATTRTVGTQFCVIQLVRVPNFESVTINPGAAITISSPAFSMTSGHGGIFVMKVNDTLTLQGSNAITIDLAGQGFAGGATTGLQGTGTSGIGGSSIAGVGNAGGGGVASTKGGGGGGGNGLSGGATMGDGGNGSGNSGSAGLGTSCVPTSSCAMFGGGGGAGSTAPGASGGGIVFLYARKIVERGYSGTLTLNSSATNTAGNESGGGGGGTAYMLNAFTSGTGAINLNANGSSGGGGTFGGGGGGGGYATSFACSANVPNAITSKLGGTAGPGGTAGNNGTGGASNYAAGAGFGNFRCP